MVRTFAKLYPHDYVLRVTILPLIPRFVTPNHLTVLRMLMTPFVAWFIFLEDYRIGLPLFVFAAFTDLIDGSLARTRSQITPWGIFFDPVADKLLIGSMALIVALKYYHPILIFLAIGLDLLPATIFLARANPRGRVMMANIWGKTKMFLQFASITCLLISIVFDLPYLQAAGEGLLGVSLIFALIATLTYSL